jgi:hypothetical protein
LIFVFWGALWSATPRAETVTWRRGEDYKYIKQITKEKNMYIELYTI